MQNNNCILFALVHLEFSLSGLHNFFNKVLIFQVQQANLIER